MTSGNGQAATREAGGEAATVERGLPERHTPTVPGWTWVLWLSLCVALQLVCTLLLVFGVLPELRAVASSVRGEREAEAEHLRLIRDARERERIDRARILLEQRDLLRELERLRKERK